MSHIPIPLFDLILYGRILLACMKFLGRCPCPRCLITKDRIYRLGTKADQWICSKMAHVDDEHRWWSINNVRKAIFEAGCSIVSKVVENIIGPKSLVPTRVHSIPAHTTVCPDFLASRMPFLRSSASSASTSTPYLCLTSCMSSNSVYGRRQSPTSFASYLKWAKIWYRN